MRARNIPKAVLRGLQTALRAPALHANTPLMEKMIIIAGWWWAR
jgi:hypothetical protein